ncbi:MAG: DUF3089 domain-containing protein, partial [Woeseiaceae bacterium]
LKISLWSLGTVVVLLVGLVTIGPLIFMRMVAPDHEFGSRALPPAPDYAQRSNWSAWPDDASPAERLPDGVSQIPQAERLADAFFVHPTSYGGKDSWVQPIDDEDARRSTDRFSISRQASAFNACCRVYAPRFRQSNIMGYQEERFEEIFDVGYQDVRVAFRHFLDEIDRDSPIVLGSHSQGSFQMARLIAEEIDGTPLMERLVAAYVIGHQLSNALVDDVYQDVALCSSATQIGCLISWDAHEGDKTPSGMADNGGQKNWNGTDYSGFDAAQNICVNPITWTTTSQLSAKVDDLGALAMLDKGSESDASLGELVSGTVSAHCENGEHSNWLFVSADRSPKLKSQGFWSLFGRNLHGSDYGMFWANIRQNAVDRSRALIEAREAKEE